MKKQKFWFFCSGFIGIDEDAVSPITKYHIYKKINQKLSKAFNIKSIDLDLKSPDRVIISIEGHALSSSILPDVPDEIKQKIVSRLTPMICQFSLKINSIMRV